jgi:hypothetical protein
MDGVLLVSMSQLLTVSRSQIEHVTSRDRNTWLQRLTQTHLPNTDSRTSDGVRGRKREILGGRARGLLLLFPTLGKKTSRSRTTQQAPRGSST